MSIAAETAVGTALADAAARLSAAGISDARREARLLVAEALGWDAARVLGFPEAEMTAAAGRRLGELIARRSAREPISRILGYREFWSLHFELSPETLDPRPDSETLIESALAALGERERVYRVLDFGTGSGCLLLALLSEYPKASGIGVDVVPGAAATARRNAERLSMHDRASFIAGDWGAALAGGFDLVVANPPYIASVALAQLLPEVRDHDPHRALDGGADGLAAYRAIAGELARLLMPSGLFAAEIGIGQDEAVARIIAAGGLAVEPAVADLAGIPRVILARRPGCPLG
jgi:release factor glutamine methyltransferase